MIATLKVDAPLAGYQQLMRWATSLGQRQWAVENTRGGSAAERNEAIVGGFVNENRVLIPDVLLADVPRGVPRSGRDHGQRD
jgi:hypothetical protein